MTATRNSLARVLVVITTVGMIAGNIAATTLPLFGRSTADVSARYQTLVTPAGFTFAIWVVIYAAMLAYSYGQFREPLASDVLPDRLAAPVIVSNIANLTWLALWHSLNIWPSVAVMLVLVASLATAYLWARRDRPEPGRLERLTVRVPLSIYLGWVSVATIANVSAALYGSGWRGFGVPPDWWAVLVLTAGALVAFSTLIRYDDGILSLVFVWAYAGIAVGTTAQVVTWAAGTLAAILATAVAISAILTRRLI